MGKLIYISGGARSGKSTFAVDLAKSISSEISFIATCEPMDNEMKIRVKKHQESRPKTWETIVETSDLARSISKINAKTHVVIIDCLTIYVSNLICSKKSEKYIINNINKLIRKTKIAEFSTIIVSNEVGLGIVPVNKMAREFRDIAGKINQIVASSSDEAYFMVSGLKLQLKDCKG